MTTPDADASGATPIPTQPDPAIMDAIARVEASFRVVLAHIATIQREMGIPQSRIADVPLKPDSTWVGTP
jgi:hypothetical protein